MPGISTAIAVPASAGAAWYWCGNPHTTLSAAVARGQVLAERVTALLIDLTAVAAATGLAMWVFSLAFGMHLGVAAIASAAAALGIFGFFTGAVALAMGAATGSAALARGLAALAAVALYLINALAQVTSTLKPVPPLSPFYLLFGNRAAPARAAGSWRAVRPGSQPRPDGRRRHRVRNPRPGLTLGALCGLASPQA